jgi:hypothetical protein
MTDRSVPTRRLVLILDQRQDRLDVMARALTATVPDARMLLSSAVKDITQTVDPLPEVILVRTDPDG